MIPTINTLKIFNCNESQSPNCSFAGSGKSSRAAHIKSTSPLSLACETWR
jgi:hypothetical protein